MRRMSPVAAVAVAAVYAALDSGTGHVESTAGYVIAYSTGSG
jgi:hypothetical protein